MYYKVNFPVTRDMGPYSTIAHESALETKEENALWDYNRARAHDGLAPFKQLPKGTTFQAIIKEA